jgi:hypothetical protein
MGTRNDISFHNLMFENGTGILNDFDLAAITKPGDANPPKTGHCRTGTAMFMSLDMLTHAEAGSHGRGSTPLLDRGADVVKLTRS